MRQYFITAALFAIATAQSIVAPQPVYELRDEMQPMQKKIAESLDDWSVNDLEIMQRQMTMISIEKKRQEMQKNKKMRRVAKKDHQDKMNFFFQDVVGSMPDSQRIEFVNECQDLFGNQTNQTNQTLNCSVAGNSTFDEPSAFSYNVSFGPKLSWFDSNDLDGQSERFEMGLKANTTLMSREEAESYFLNRIEATSASDQNGWYWNFYNGFNDTVWEDFDEGETNKIILDQKNKKVVQVVMYADGSSLRGLSFQDDYGNVIGELGVVESGSTGDSYQIGAPSYLSLDDNQYLTGVKGMQWDNSDVAPVQFQFQILTIGQNW